MKVVFVSVLRNADMYDCTNHGLSSRVFNSHLFFDCTHDEAIKYCEEHNMDTERQFYLVPRRLWGEDHAYAEPLVKPNGMHQCFGGNFLYTSDSRMYRTGGKYHVPIPVHDRFETYEDYNALTV